MMTAILIGIILGLLGIVVKQFRRIRRGMRGEEYLAAINQEWAWKYAELDKGMYEQADSYEQDFISFRETIETQERQVNGLEEENAELKAHLEKHDRECLPSTYDASWLPHVTSDESVDPPLFKG